MLKKGTKNGIIPQSVVEHFESWDDVGFTREKDLVYWEISQMKSPFEDSRQDKMTEYLFDVFR